MKASLLSIMMIVFVSSLQAQYNKDNLKIESTTANTKYSYKNLRVYPVRANKVFEAYHRNIGKYTTLKEGLAKNKIKITEQGSGDVNTLFIENISSDTVMILVGEVIQGGKQDRMIAQDFILYPKSGKKDVSVFCVEHGRWQEGSNGKSFNQYYSISSTEVRKAGAVKKDQQEVWDKVAKKTAENNAESSTGTLTALKSSEEFTSELKGYTDFFRDLLKEEKDVIGIVAVTGDVILGCDMFATHDIFKEHYGDLVNSYATDAISAGKNVTLPDEKVNEYFDFIIEDEDDQERKVNEKGTMLKDRGRKLHISTFD